MRLRLLVRRHNLPDTAVLWSVEDGENPIISQLLDQVNEVIPLESDGDWGLEDYAVEIRGSGTNFECLHFQLVRNVLHEDDEVLIRPLLSHDLKLRRVSGRRQISSDGKHLFDGWVFGKPRPRGPVERPAIEIPPRKRRRITYFEESDSSFDENPLSKKSQAEIGSESEGNRQLILSADFEDDDEEEDGDFDPSGENYDDDDDEEDGGQDLNGYNDPVQDDASVDNSRDELDNEDRSWNARGLTSDPLKSLAPDQVVLRTIPTRSKTKLSSKYKEHPFRHEKALNTNHAGGARPPQEEEILLLKSCDQHGLPRASVKTGTALSKLGKIASASNSALLHESGRRALRNTITRSTTGSTKKVRFSGGVCADTVLIQEDSDESEDEDFDPESHVIEPDMSSDNSTDESSDNEEINKAHLDGLSSSGSNRTSSSETTSESESESESESDSDAEPEEISSRTVESQRTVLQVTCSGKKTPSKEQKSLQKIPVPPGQGKNWTRNRNRRRRLNNLLQRYKSKGILPAGTTIKEFEQLQLNKSGNMEGIVHGLTENGIGGSQESYKNSAEKIPDFEVRRQMLLDSLATGGVEVEAQSFLESSISVPSSSAWRQPEISGTMTAAEPEISSALSIDKTTGPFASRNADGGTELCIPAKKSDHVNAQGQYLVVKESTTADEAPRSRRKIDLGAAGRLLFGALGVRAPKNKSDHEKVRNELIKDIRLSKPGTTEKADSTEIEGLSTDEDPEAWHEVINLRAVECCYEGVELSPAPFPFVQRWDPQQQGIYSKHGNRGGKGKRNQRNQHQYYEDEQQSSRKRKRGQNFYDTYQDSYDQAAITEAAYLEGADYRGEGVQMGSSGENRTQIACSDGIEEALNEQLMMDIQEAATSQAADEDDLPRLPDDISILPNFSDEDIKPGMVIAFKQLILSEATNWQPQISTYRTAVLIKASGNGSLELRLAKRDREHATKCFDRETGERIYGKFDMPTDDDQNNDEDDGFLEVTIGEIAEPKIVQLAPESLSASASLPDLLNKDLDFAENSALLDHTDHSNASQPSAEASFKVNEEIIEDQNLCATNDNPHTLRKDLCANTDDVEALSISEDTREEISILIKDAGFRSSIPSSVVGTYNQLPNNTRNDSKGDAYSPKFNGFESLPSQTIKAIITPSPSDQTVHEIGGPNNESLEIKPAISKVHYSKLSAPLSVASQVSDRGRQPDYPIPEEASFHQFDEPDSFSSAHSESLLSRNGHLPPSGSSSNGNKLPSYHSRSTSEDSSAGLPTLEEVFSTARSSVGLKHEPAHWLPQKTKMEDEKKIQDSYDREMEALDAMLEEAEEPEHVRFKVSGEQGSAASQAESGSQFSIPPGSQKVDLTLSSDAEISAGENNSDDSYNDAYGLLRGSSRAERTTRETRSQRHSNPQTPSQKVKRTRSKRSKNMTKS